MQVEPLTRDQIAAMVVEDIPADSYINLGIGMPSRIVTYLPSEMGVVLHSENGILGMRNLDRDEQEDPDLISAGKDYVALEKGAAISDHVVSFAMMRGGHIDVTVMGAFQVSASGDLANWDRGDGKAIPGVGGAMDLVVGARKVYVMMRHLDQQGRSKIVPECTYPLTGSRVVNRVYTDLAIMDILPSGLTVRAIIDGLSFAQLQEMTTVELRLSPDCYSLYAQ